MAEYIKTLKEDNGDTTYPVTQAGAVLLSGGGDLETTLNSKASQTSVDGKIDIGDVQTTDIAANAVTAAKIADGAVTPAKMTYSTYGRFSRDNEGGSQAYTANTAATATLPGQNVAEVGCSYSGGVITVSQAGWWVITAGGRLSAGGSSANYGVSRIKINGTAVAVSNGTGYANSSVGATFNGNMVWQGHLAAGDTVLLEIQPYLTMTNTSATQQHMEGVCLFPD